MKNILNPVLRFAFSSSRLLAVDFAAVALAAGVLSASNLIAAEQKSQSSLKPLRALLITGGCCHDYDNQKKILSEGISARANVEWTIVQEGGTSTKHKVSTYDKPDWAKGFDVVVHNECFADEKDLDWLERIVKPHREGIPAVVIHCAMHCYRAPTNEWFKFLGVTSHRHGSHFAYEVKKREAGTSHYAEFSGDMADAERRTLQHRAGLAEHDPAWDGLQS